ncbi:MFS transporter [candidate division KSB1 bacterium]|nr:MFS transporter [candidate division KSB1 bacterium]
MTTDSTPKVSKQSALIVATLAAFLLPLVGASVNIALPKIGDAFELEAVRLSWVASIFLLSAAVFMVPFGRVADIYGRKLIFVIGVSIFSIASLVSAIASTSLMLIVGRLIQGIGSAMMFGTGVAILTSVFPPEERGRALGINVAAVYLGLSLGPFLGGVLVEYLGWRSIFWANVPPGILIIILVFWKLRDEWAEAEGESFDGYGSVIYAIMLIMLMYGFSILPAWQGFCLVGGGLLGLALFVRWEQRVEHPVLDILLFKQNRVFAYSNLAALINYAATFAVTFLMSLYLQYIKAMSPQQAGLILVAQPAVMTLFSPFAGRLSDRIEPRKVSSIGMSLTTLGLAILIFLNGDTPIWFLILNLMLLGAGFGLFSSPNTNAVMGSVERKFYGVASGTVGTMRLTGQMFSMGIAMLIFSVVIGPYRITPQYYPQFLQSMKIAFVIFTVLCLGGIFASLARGTMHTNNVAIIQEK